MFDPKLVEVNSLDELSELLDSKKGDAMSVRIPSSDEDFQREISTKKTTRTVSITIRDHGEEGLSVESENLPKRTQEDRDDDNVVPEVSEILIGLIMDDFDQKAQKAALIHAALTGKVLGEDINGNISIANTGTH